MRLQRSHEVGAELGDLPAPQLGDLGELLDGRRVPARDGFHAIARAEHAGVELQSLGSRVARGLQRADPRVELRIAVPSRGARELRELGLGDGERAAHRVQQLGAALLEDRARHPLDLAQRVLASRGCERAISSSCSLPSTRKVARSSVPATASRQGTSSRSTASSRRLRSRAPLRRRNADPGSSSAQRVPSSSANSSRAQLHRPDALQLAPSC